MAIDANTTSPNGEPFVSGIVLDAVAPAGDEGHMKSPAPAASTRSLSLYSSLPLPASEPDSIRLLDLKTPKKDWRGNFVDEPLAGRVRVARLSESPRFTALSYVWGEKTEPSHTIRITTENSDSRRSLSSSQLELTANCYAALLKIRKRFSPVTIWVDAICINQNDDDEKAVQIPLMRDIYTWAETVFIWLGEGTRSSDAAMDYLNKWGAARTRSPLSLLAANGEARRVEQTSKFRALRNRDRFTRFQLLLNTWKGRKAKDGDVEELLGRNWLHRVWTFQEVILAANPVLLCGDAVLSWESLVNAIFITKEFKDTWFPGGRLLSWLFRRNPSPRTLTCESSRPFELWRRLIELWLIFPRAARWNGSMVRSFPPLLRRGSGRLKYFQGFKSAPAAKASSTPIPHFSIRPPSHMDGVVCWSSGVLSPRESPLRNPFDGWNFFSLVGSISALYWGRWLEFILVGDRLAQADFYDRLGEDDQGATAGRILAGLDIALRHRECARPHDRAFGLDGVLWGFGAASAGPSYHEPLNEIFRRLMERLITWQPAAVSMLVDCGPTGPGGGPTWVPPWSHGGSSSWLSARYNVSSHCAIPASHEASISVAPTDGRVTISMEILPPEVDTQALRLKAARGGVVNHRVVFQKELPPDSEAESRAVVAKDFQEENIKAMLMFLRRWVNEALRNNSSSLVRSVDCWGLFLATKAYETDDQHLELEECPDADKAEFELFTRIVHQALLQAHHEEGEPRDFDCSAKEQSATSALYDNIKATFPGSCELLTSLINQAVLQERCLFISSANRPGSGPLWTRTEDGIFRLQGVPCPMLLRRAELFAGQDAGEAYTIVGPALVYGLMGKETLSLDRLEDLAIV